MNRWLTILFGILFICLSANAQTKNGQIEEPQFPGGRKGLLKYLEENIVYPEEMRRLSKEGEVIVAFIVERDGVISGVSIVKSLTKEFDEEAIRLVRYMPYWIPGKKNGVPVRYRMTMPINFKFKVQNKKHGYKAL